MKDDFGSFAVFTEQGSSVSHMAAATVLEVTSRMSGCAVEAGDAVPLRMIRTSKRRTEPRARRDAPPQNAQCEATPNANVPCSYIQHTTAFKSYHRHVEQDTSTCSGSYGHFNRHNRTPWKPTGNIQSFVWSGVGRDTKQICGTTTVYAIFCKIGLILVDEGV